LRPRDRARSNKENDVRTQYKVFLTTCWLAAVGCGSSKSAEEPSSEASSGGDAAYAGPIASTDAAHGKEVFSNFCGDCHPDGGEDVGPSLIATPHTPERIRKQIREGGGKMRPFSDQRLGKDDMEAILAYLASINAVK
jgi:mono/diheme cytochrome c family protein